MSRNALPSQSIKHPAPHRDRIGSRALWFGLTAAPLAWSLHLLFSTALVGHDCYPHQHPLVEPLWQGLRPVLLGICVAGIALALAGGVVAWRSWQRTRHEQPDSAHQLLDRGEGRTRFMGMSGMIVSALFMIALAFGTAAFLMVPLCGD